MSSSADELEDQAATPKPVQTDEGPALDRPATELIEPDRYDRPCNATPQSRGA